MAHTGPRDDQSYAEHAGLRPEGREPGARRKMFKGYLKAANELRQSYFSQDGTRDRRHVEDGPGAFPDTAVVRSGNEEMILFPSYARRHVKSKHPAAATPGREMTDEGDWRRERYKHENVDAIVDVDVRGWIYNPPKGQHTRRQRMLIGLARRLSGIPAPATNRPGDSSRSRVGPSRASSPTRQQDEDLINLEAENVVRRGQQEQRYANRGAFSERPGQKDDMDSLYGDVPDRGRPKSYASSIASIDSDAGTPNDPIQKGSSWQPPENMSSAELATANMHLLSRLKPFMANPLANTPISAFFYNESSARQQTVYTDAYGHFTLRAALDFVPTHVRVLASETLSATEAVIVTPPQGVSLISDIDDTIKHSAISAGVREIFRNAFIRELGDLTIEGVQEWYTTLHDMGVKIHYVSNSPWQMYPALIDYLELANLPKGSFHLKQYSGGKLQGILEPVAERKRSTLDRIMRDFPDRKFILVGDSGEADLEVYTETAIAYPGRVLGIFIRDVTAPVRTGYFDSNNSPGASVKHPGNHSRGQSGDSLAPSKRFSRPADLDDDAEVKATIAASLADMELEAQRARRSINPDAYRLETAQPAGRYPNYPCYARPPKQSGPKSSQSPEAPPKREKAVLPEDDLINFFEPPSFKPWLELPQRRDKPMSKTSGTASGTRPSPSPPPPPKPFGLKIPPPDADSTGSAATAHKTPPPRPRKPSSAVKSVKLPQIQTHQTSPLSQITRQEPTRKPPPPLPARRNVKGATAKALPMPNTSRYWRSEISLGQTGPHSSYAARNGGSQPPSPLAVGRSMSSPRSFEYLNLPTAAINPVALLPPPHRGATTYSTAVIRKQTDRLSGGFDDDGITGSPGDGLSKKEYLWQQRWVRARSVLERNGVTLRSWQSGADVADVCVMLVEMELRKIERESQNKENDTRR